MLHKGIRAQCKIFHLYQVEDSRNANFSLAESIIDQERIPQAIFDDIILTSCFSFYLKIKTTLEIANWGL